MMFAALRSAGAEIAVVPLAGLPVIFAYATPFAAVTFSVTRKTVADVAGVWTAGLHVTKEFG
jgi:hypothetical protein